MTSLNVVIYKTSLEVELSKSSLKITPIAVNGAGAFSNSFSVSFAINKQA